MNLETTKSLLKKSEIQTRILELINECFYQFDVVDARIKDYNNDPHFYPFFNKENEVKELNRILSIRYYLERRLDNISFDIYFMIPKSTNN